MPTPERPAVLLVTVAVVPLTVTENRLLDEVKSNTTFALLVTTTLFEPYVKDTWNGLDWSGKARTKAAFGAPPASLML